MAAFDPFGKNIEKAKRLLKPYPNINFYQLALSTTNGHAGFYINKNDQNSSLLTNNTGKLKSFADDTTLAGSCEVETRTHDRWGAEHKVTGPCIIKCGIQGAEGLVIKGGKSFIRSYCIAFYGDVILVDMHNGQSSFGNGWNLLENACSLVLRNVYPCLHDKTGRAVQMDVLWVHHALSH